MMRLTISLVLAVLLLLPATASAAKRRCGFASNGFLVLAGNAKTSCSFAKATANTYFAQRTSVIRVYSRVTKRRYTMRCRFPSNGEGGKYLLCTGGNGARVEVYT